MPIAKISHNYCNSHIISLFAYCMPVWGGNLGTVDKRRLNSLLFRVIRMHCRDFSRILSNKELCQRSKIQSLTSIRIQSDALMLFKLTTQPTNLDLTLRLVQQCTFSCRYPEKISFFDYSSKKIGKMSFVNRAKMICELIPFQWLDMSLHQFKSKLSECIALHIR